MEEERRRLIRSRRCLARDRKSDKQLQGSLPTLTSSPQETDKATMDVEAQEDGVLAKILVRLSLHVDWGCVLTPDACRYKVEARMSQSVLPLR